MYRLAYRNVKGTDTWLVTHTIDNGRGGTAVRWYEVHASSGRAAFIYQQGTYAPDGADRFMGSIAMDKFGDIAVGCSVSSPTIHPSIRFAGRTPSLTRNKLGPESSILEGTGSATNGRCRQVHGVMQAIDRLHEPALKDDAVTHGFHAQHADSFLNQLGQNQLFEAAERK